MSNLLISAAVANNKGLIRGNNEDNYYLNGTHMEHDKLDNGALATYNCRDPFQVYAVCDGMGGTEAGEEASFCAVHELSLLKDECQKMTDPEYQKAVLSEISSKIYEDAYRRGQNSGTTIAMIFVMEDRVCVTNVGDSRVYRFRNGQLRQMSLDHSKVQRLISMGVLTPEQARTDPRRHVINQYLGMPSDIQIEPYMVPDVELGKGDLYLICSDGLTDMVEDSQIQNILSKEQNPKEAVKALVETALKNGGRDNVTVMLVQAVQISDKPLREKKTKERRHRLRPLITVGQVAVGACLLVTIMDLFFFLSRR